MILKKFYILIYMLTDYIDCDLLEEEEEIDVESLRNLLGNVGSFFQKREELTFVNDWNKDTEDTDDIEYDIDTSFGDIDTKYYLTTIFTGALLGGGVGAVFGIGTAAIGSLTGSVSGYIVTKIMDSRKNIE